MSGFLLDTNRISEVEFEARFSGRILPIDTAVADRRRCLPAQQSAEKDCYRRFGGLLPATALPHNLTIVSRNVSDFANTEALILNPWEQ